MDPRHTQAILDLHRLLKSLTERTTKLLMSLEKRDPLHSAVREIDEDVRKVTPLVQTLFPPEDASAVTFVSRQHFAAASKPTILYIDDNPDRLTLLRAVLEMKGYSVLTAEYGRKGLELFLSETVELVILDYTMPGMNGEQVARRMRLLRPEVPILIFSGSLTLPDKVIAMVDGFISTSEEPEVLLERVGSLLGRTQAKAS